MRIVIVGAGAVGFNLATELSREGYNVAVIEQNPVLIKRISDKLDVQVVKGSGTDKATLEKAGIQGAEFLIAVTNMDEVNQVVCMMGHAYGVRRKIARIRNRDFTGKDPLISKREFHINRIINPDEITIDYIMKIMESPGVSLAGEFAKGEIQLRGFHITGDEQLSDKPLYQLKETFSDFPFLIAAIKRGEEIIIPTGMDVLKAGDTIYLIMTMEGHHQFQNILPSGGGKTSKVVIAGAGRIGLELAMRLEQKVDMVTLVDEDREACMAASTCLKKGLAVTGDPLDDDVAKEVHMERADFFVAANEDDHLNLISALLAKKRGVKRTAIITNDPDIVEILGTLDVDVVVNARLIAVEEILRFVKPGKVLSVKKIGDSEAEVIEVLVGKGSKAIGKSLKEMKLPEGALVGAIYRNGKAIIPDGNSVIQVGDNVVAFVLPKVGQKLEKLLAGRKRITFVD